MQKEKVEFGNQVIEFDLEYRSRKTLGIIVLPDQNVLVKAPLQANLEKIKTRIKQRAPWILKQQRFFLRYHPLTPPRQFINGETHLYLGRQYRLKIISAEQNSVKLKGGFLEVYSAYHLETAFIKKLVLKWYFIRAKAKIEEYVAYWIEKFEKYQVKPSAIIIRPLTKRWGSCSPKGRILLNSELIKAPKGCIEYVIIHELCHLIYPNHTQKFFELLIKEMPDWERWKHRLEQWIA